LIFRLGLASWMVMVLSGLIADELPVVPYALVKLLLILTGVTALAAVLIDLRDLNFKVWALLPSLLSMLRFKLLLNIS